MIRYTPSQFARAVMQVVGQWRKFHAPGQEAFCFVLVKDKLDLLDQVRAIQLRYRNAESNHDKWIAVQAAMALGHTGDGYMVDVWGRGDFAAIVDLIRTGGALAYFDRAAFERWIGKP